MMETGGLLRRQFLRGSLTTIAAAAVVSGCRPGGARTAGAGPHVGTESEKPMKTLTVGEGRYRGRTNVAIQQAVDDVAAAGGGTVVVGPGTYAMHDALHLRSGVRVVGRDGAVLKKVPSVQSAIPDYLGYGHYEVTVREPDKFPVGTGVHIMDDDAGGFYTTVATVVGREGDRLFINRMLNHDYAANRHARVISVYPMIEAEGVCGAAVEDLAIDGNSGEESFMLNGCRGGGVFLIGSERIALRNLQVGHYRGDGISFQQSSDILLERCHVHHNVGTGLHPGSGSVRYIMQDNRVLDNGGCGIFYCLRTTHSVCRRNEVRGNGAAGISVGERDTDHLVEKNVVVGNGEEGILFRSPNRQGGDRVIVVANQVGPNATKKAAAEVRVEAGLSDVHVLDNTIVPGPGGAVWIGKGCRNVSLAGNTVGGRDQQPGDLAGEGAAEALRERPARLPDVGPAALPANGARHLNRASLDPWDEQAMWQWKG